MWKFFQKINEINELVNYAKIISSTSFEVGIPKKQLTIFQYCFQSYSEQGNLTKGQLDLMYYYQYLHVFHYQRYVALDKLCDLVPNKKLTDYLKPTPAFLKNAFFEFPNMTFREWQELSKWPKLQSAKIYYAIGQEELAMVEINGHVADRRLNEREKEVCVQSIQTEATNVVNALVFPISEESKTLGENKREMPTREGSETLGENEPGMSPEEGEWVRNEPTREDPDIKHYVSVDPRPPASSSPSPTTKWLLFGGVLLGVITGIAAVLLRTKIKISNLKFKKLKES